MSLGAANGFSYDSSLETEVYGNIFKRLQEAGILCCISAGNDGSEADYSQTKAGTGYLTTDWADYGVLSAPASYNGNTAVASADNASISSYTIKIADTDIPYRESNDTAFLDEFGGTSPEFVLVPGNGEAADYNDIDVRGKIAVISRGTTTFESKVATASAAGASGAVIYNNADDGLISMSVTTTTIPSIFIAKNGGELLKEQYAKGVNSFAVELQERITDNPNGWAVSSFSSWGATNDLQIKPQITGVGGSVSSAEYKTTNGYVIKSGTSMSSPNVAGGYAALTELLRTREPNAEKAELSEEVKSLTQASATILTGSNGVPYSPRQQGAGLMNLRTAAQSALSISQPLCELGDDPDRSGEYTVSFDVKNISDSAVSYRIETDVLTDSVAEIDVGTEDEPDVRSYNTTDSRDITERCSISTNLKNNTLTLEAGESATVTVSIRLSESLRQELNASFENGTYIEGFVRLTNDAQTLHATYLAFYGDWDAAPVIEKHDWREIMELPSYSNYQDYVQWEVNTDISLGYVCDSSGEALSYAGNNPMGTDDNIKYSDKRIALSSNGEAAYGTVLELIPTLIRNARRVVVTVTDAETGEIYQYNTLEYAEKTIYDSTYETWTSSCAYNFYGTRSYGLDEGTTELLPSDTKVSINVYASIPYGDDELGEIAPEQLKTEGAEYLQWTVPCTIDSESPEIKSWSYDYTSGELTVTVSDNQYLAGVSVVDLKQNTLAQELFGDTEPGAEHTVVLNIGKQRNFYITCMDYATNEKRQRVNALIDPCTLTYSTPDGVVVDDNQKTVTVSMGDQVVLPNVSGAVEGWEFVQWSSWVINDENEPALASGEKIGAKFKVNADTTLSAVFRTPDGVYKPTEKLGRVLESCDDWSGTWAIGGTDWINYEFYLLSGEARTLSMEDKKITVTGSATLNNTPEDMLFAIEKRSDGSYTIRSVSDGKYLTAQTSATYGIGMTNRADSAASRWEISYCAGNDEIGTVDCVRIVSAADKDKRLLFDAELGRIRCVKATDSDFGDDMLLYLYGSVQKYLYSTSPEPLHDWDNGVVTREATESAEGERLYTCRGCGETRTEVIPKLHPADDTCKGGDSCPSKAFTDMPGVKHWAHSSIDYCVSHGLFNGTTTSTFSPDAKLTRAMLVTVLWRMEGQPSAKHASFADTQGIWCASAIDWAYENGIVNGYSETIFAPDADITREQMAAILYRYASFKGVDVSKANDITGFADYGSVSDFARGALSWANAEGIINGSTNNLLMPRDGATRAQVAAMLMRYCVGVGK